MSIQGGGKLPPSTSRAQAGDRPRRAAEKRQAREAKDLRPRDTFETGGPHKAAHTPIATQQFPSGPRLEELMNQPSQIKAMAESITAHAKRLGGEFDALRTEAQALVGKLAKDGFSPDAVAESREEVGGLRRQMAQLRGKIAADGRRLKLLKSAATRLGDTRLADKVGAQLKKIAEMEHGWGRAFLALGIAGTLGPSADGEAQISRVQLGAGGQIDRHALGGYLATISPGTAASQLLVALLEEGPHGPSGRLIAEAYAELHADVMAGRFGKALQGLGLWRQAMG